MAVLGKSINLFLMDCEPSGNMKCTLSNWTGIAYKIHRTALDKCKDMDILSKVVYIFSSVLIRKIILWFILARLVFTEKW